MSDREDIIKVVETFFETGKTKNLGVLKYIQLDSDDFSSFRRSKAIVDKIVNNTVLVNSKQNGRKATERIR